MSDASDYCDDVCGVCGATYDFCYISTDYNEAGLCVCINDHSFCAKHSIKPLDSTLTEDDDNWIDFGGVDASYCPICTDKASKNFTKHITDPELLIYCMKKSNFTKKMLLSMAKKQFKTGDEFLAYIKN